MFTIVSTLKKFSDNHTYLIDSKELAVSLLHLLQLPQEVPAKEKIHFKLRDYKKLYR